MYLPELLKLIAAGPERLQHAAELASRLMAIDKERAAILAELAEMGVAEQTSAPAPTPLAPNVPLCEVCGKEANEQVDDVWCCAAHGDAAIEQRMKPAAE